MGIKKILKRRQELQAQKLQQEKQKEAMKKQMEEVMRQREVVKTIIYPFFIEKGVNVAEIKSICNSINIALQQAAQKKLQGITIGMLGVEHDLSLNVEFDIFRDFVKKVENEGYFTLSSMLQGFVNTISGLIEQEAAKKTLKEVIPDMEKMFPSVNK